MPRNTRTNASFAWTVLFFCGLILHGSPQTGWAQQRLPAPSLWDTPQTAAPPTTAPPTRPTDHFPVTQPPVNTTVAPTTNIIESNQPSSQPAEPGLVQQVRQTFAGMIPASSLATREMFDKYLLRSTLALGILFAGYMFASFLSRVTGQFIAERVDKTIGKFAGKLVFYGAVVFAALGVLGFCGVDVTSFAAVLAASGFAIGMALQGTLSNFAAGVMLLVFRPFKVDDFIMVGGNSGKVEEIDLFTTKLNTPDNRHLILPNGQIFGSVIENVTRNRLRRVDVTVGASYNADLRHTRQVLTDAVAMVPGAVGDPGPQIVLTQLADSSVNWECRVWCRTEDYLDVKQRVIAAVKDGMDLGGIAIPFPQLDLHVVSQTHHLERKAA